MTAPPPARDNHLLAALPADTLLRWQPELEAVDMPLGQVIYEAGGPQTHVYFPTTAIVSLPYVMESGASAEIALVGNEGVVGTALFRGGESTPSRAVVQSAGRGVRMSAKVIHTVRFHLIGPRLARWLLMSQDRAHGDSFHVTHEFLSYMLGVRRVRVTLAAGHCKTGGSFTTTAAISRCSTVPGSKPLPAPATPSTGRPTLNRCAEGQAGLQVHASRCGTAQTNHHADDYKHGEG